MSSDDQAHSRKRLSRDERRRQLLDVAWQLVREEGTDALSLGRLAEQAGVTKPVVYDHFETRTGLLVALYQQYDARQTRMLEQALVRCDASLASRAGVIAEAYVDCVMSGGVKYRECRRHWPARRKWKRSSGRMSSRFWTSAARRWSGFRPVATLGWRACA